MDTRIRNAHLADLYTHLRLFQILLQKYTKHRRNNGQAKTTTAIRENEYIKRKEKKKTFLATLAQTTQSYYGAIVSDYPDRVEHFREAEIPNLHCL